MRIRYVEATRWVALGEAPPRPYDPETHCLRHIHYHNIGHSWQKWLLTRGYFSAILYSRYPV
jgi:hypothetical protein